MGHRLRDWHGSFISVGHQVDVLLLSLDGSFSFSFPILVVTRCGFVIWL